MWIIIGDVRQILKASCNWFKKKNIVDINYQQVYIGDRRTADGRKVSGSIDLSPISTVYPGIPLKKIHNFRIWLICVLVVNDLITILSYLNVYAMLFKKNPFYNVASLLK